MDPEQLDFDPEEDDETMLRLKALETQVFCVNKLNNHENIFRPRN